MAGLVKNSLKAQAYEYLKKCIIEGKLESDVLYTEMNLAKELEISRTPIREAVLQLAHEDFVILKPNKGFIVRNYSVEDIADYLDVRRAVEGFCGTKTVDTRGTEEWKEMICKLEKILEEAETKLKKKNNSIESMKKDTEFHFTIVDYSNNRQMTKIMMDIRDKMNKIGVDSEKKEGRSEATIIEHRKILEAIREGTKADIQKAYEEHFDRCLDEMKEQLTV